MKNVKKRFLEELMFCAFSLVVFVGLGYSYITYETAQVKVKEEQVPYYSAVPEKAGILFRICDKETFVCLDFEEKSIRLLFTDDTSPEINGYKVDYTVSGDYELVGAIVDMIGGIDLEIDGEALNYTGVQVSEILTAKNDSDEMRQEIITKIIAKVAEQGFGSEDLVYIIENSDTNLTVPKCYNWAEYIGELCGFVKIIN